jgi:hypothetical protein
MQQKSPGTVRNLRQVRASVTDRRKMASLRVSLQRRRLQRIVRLSTDNSAIFNDSSVGSHSTDMPSWKHVSERGDAA